MALSACNTETDSAGRELTVHGTAAFPIACYHDDLEAAPVPWHWHEEVEFVYVREGSMRLLTAGQERSFEKGEGFFVNTNVLCSMENQDHCQIDSHLLNMWRA